MWMMGHVHHNAGRGRLQQVQATDGGRVRFATRASRAFTKTRDLNFMTIPTSRSIVDAMI